MEKLLHSIYYDSSNSAGFGSVKALLSAARKIDPKIKLEDVKDWLASQLTYTLHRQRRVNFKRKKIVVTHSDEQWQADLVDLQKFKRFNNGYGYLLTVVDLFSKYAWAVPIKDKSSKSVVKAFSKIFEERIPEKLQTDQGKEFENKDFKELMNKHSINFFTTRNTEIKCACVERFNRTLRSKMFKYFTSKGTKKYTDVLGSFLKTYNSTTHRTTGFKPIDVNDDNNKAIFKKMHGVSTKRELLIRQQKDTKTMSINDKVRIAYQKAPLEKGYYPVWTDEIFSISKVIKGKDRVTYEIKDYQGKEIEGRFYPEELQKVNEILYRVEKEIRRRTRNGIKEVLVKWLS